MNIKLTDNIYFPSLKDVNFIFFDKLFTISLNEVGDLLWTIRSRDGLPNCIIVSKDDYDLYSLLYKLFNDIKENYPTYFTADIHTVYLKSDIAFGLFANWLNFYNPGDDIISLSFHEFYEPFINHYPDMLTLRFTNFGSKHAGLNSLLMNMYRDMQNLDDTKDYGHLIHMEEILYNKEQEKRLELSKKRI